MGPVGVPEMVVILLVALVLFGPKKLPELGRTIGKAMTEFRRAQAELKATFDTHMRELEKEGESIKDATRSYTNEIYNHYTAYDAPAFSDSLAYPGAEQHSIAANPSTVSEPATQGAESSVSLKEAPVNGTVPRTLNSPEPPAGRTLTEPAAPESINT